MSNILTYDTNRAHFVLNGVKIYISSEGSNLYICLIFM